MVVISINLPEKVVQQLDKLREEKGFAGRSEAVRAAIRYYTEELGHENIREGMVEGVLILIQAHHPKDRMDIIAHDFSGLISTQLHQHLSCGRCLNLFILKGSFNEIQNLISTLRRVETIEHLKFVITGFFENGKCTGHTHLNPDEIKG